tara:strand:- start:3010 stop:4449 length:1440 start_codon:yes stop_codon:yes gene_type:complete
VKIAIVHYHLRRGGVTRVIEDAVASLEGHGVETVVLAGESYLGDRLPNVRVIEGLGYRNTATEQDARHLAREMQSAVTDALGTDPDLWHIHNHSLAKNVAFPEAVHHLLLDGAKLLLQVHDFAEDGRPANYERQTAYYAGREDSRAEQLYPRGTQIHYATLNQRDSLHLCNAGIDAGHLHWLPNSVTPPPCSQPRTDPFPGKRFILYPVRGIRRKNLGELMLLSLLNPDAVFGVTLEPENPEWRQIHDEWAKFSRQHRLPVHLAYGRHGPLSYPELIHRADVMISTSVAEGFGLAFLEPWLADKAVVGRDLPKITRDFVKQGVKLDHLYQRLEIPMKWIDEPDLHAALADGLFESYQSYNREPPADAVDRAWATTVRAHRVDFGRLSESFQRQALERCLSEPNLRHSISAPTLALEEEDRIAENRELIEQSYSLSQYGPRLLEIYREIAASPLGELSSYDADAVLDAFLAPENFNLLRA